MYNHIIRYKIRMPNVSNAGMKGSALSYITCPTLIVFVFLYPHFVKRITRKQMEEEKERKKAKLMTIKKIRLRGTTTTRQSTMMQAPPEEEEEDPSEIIVIDTGMFSVKVCHLTSTEYRLIVLTCRLYAQC